MLQADGPHDILFYRFLMLRPLKVWNNLEQSRAIWNNLKQQEKREKLDLIQVAIILGIVKLMNSNFSTSPGWKSRDGLEHKIGLEYSLEQNYWSRTRSRATQSLESRGLEQNGLESRSREHGLESRSRSLGLVSISLYPGRKRKVLLTFQFLTPDIFRPGISRRDRDFETETETYSFETETRDHFARDLET